MRKQHRSLAELHYSKAVCLFLSLKDAPCELLRTLLERVAFAEFTMAGEQLFVMVNDGMLLIFGFVLREGLNLRAYEHLYPQLLKVMFHIVFSQVRAAVQQSLRA